jgi:hypothetical protein
LALTLSIWLQPELGPEFFKGVPQIWRYAFINEEHRLPTAVDQWKGQCVVEGAQQIPRVGTPEAKSNHPTLFVSLLKHGYWVGGRLPSWRLRARLQVFQQQSLRTGLDCLCVATQSM